VKPGSAKLAGGQMTLDLDMKGGLTKKNEVRPITPVKAGAPPAGSPGGGGAVTGRIENQFKDLKSKLSDFLKRIETNAKAHRRGGPGQHHGEGRPVGDPGPVFDGTVTGTVSYDEGKWSGTIGGKADLKLPGLEKIAKGTVGLGLEVDAHINPDGSYGGTIKSTKPIQFGKYPRSRSASSPATAPCTRSASASGSASTAAGGAAKERRSASGVPVRLPGV